MQKKSETQGYAVERVYEANDGQRIEHEQSRKAGKRPGTFIGDCPTCNGIGAMRLDLPGMGWETCHSCEGEGTVVRDGEREGDSDRRTQPTWGDVLRFSLMVAFFTAFGCYLLYTYAKVH